MSIARKVIAKNETDLMVPGMVTIKSVIGDSCLGDQEEIMTGPVKSLMNEIQTYGFRVFMQIKEI
ncbi:hypothetical protein [Lacrimispora amygdalina]